jgi:hypothetical protein
VSKIVHRETEAPVVDEDQRNVEETTLGETSDDKPLDETPVAEKQAEGKEEGKEEEQAESIDVHFGDEKPKEESIPAPSWVREVRKQNRELLKKNKELEWKLTEVVEQKLTTLGVKPSLEQFDYDAERYEKALASWFDEKRRFDEAEAEKRNKAKREKADWQAKLDSYAQAKTTLKVVDYEDAEDTVESTLDVTQQGIILQGAENPALLVYALGKDEKRAKELAAIKDPVKFAFAISKLEASMRVNRRSVPAPEKTVSGGMKPGGSVHLERLREEAARTGDFSKVVAYKNQQKKGR